MAIFVAIAALLCLATGAVLLRPLWRDARGVALGMGVVMLASSGVMRQPGPMIGRGSPLASLTSMQ